MLLKTKSLLRILDVQRQPGSTGCFLLMHLPRTFPWAVLCGNPSRPWFTAGKVIPMLIQQALSPHPLTGLGLRTGFFFFLHTCGVNQFWSRSVTSD